MLLWLDANLSFIDSSPRSLQAAQLLQKFYDAQELHLTHVFLIRRSCLSTTRSLYLNDKTTVHTSSRAAN